MPSIEAFVAAPAAWVDRVERAYVAAVTGGPSMLAMAGDVDVDITDHDIALAISYAIAARFLAVGTPRTIGIAADGSTSAVACIAAMGVFFSPREFRLYMSSPGDSSAHGLHSKMPATQASTIDEVIACDIVCDFLSDSSLADKLTTHARRGCHFNLRRLPAQAPDPSWLTATAGTSLPFDNLAKTNASTTLPRLAAGLDDGRQLDEVSLFAAEELRIAHYEISAQRSLLS